MGKRNATTAFAPINLPESACLNGFRDLFESFAVARRDIGQYFYGRD
jgi:hypothetical protein